IERALLALALPDQRAAIVRRLEEELSLQPRDPEADERRFKTALQGRALESDDALGLRGMQVAAQAALAKEDASFGEMDDMPELEKAAAPAKKAKRAERRGRSAGPDAEESEAPPPGAPAADFDEFGGGGAGRALRDMSAREAQAPRWRQLDKTQELAE